MNLDKLICIEATKLSIEKFKAICHLASKEFNQYSFDYKEPYTWFKSVPNPDYNPDIISRNNEETILEHRNADCGFDMQLNNVNHINFNIKCFMFQGNIYITQGVYYYAHFNADNLKAFIERYLEEDDAFELLCMAETCHTENDFAWVQNPIYDKKTYQQWINEHPDQKWAQHNYKIDKEDLAKIGIEV